MAEALLKGEELELMQKAIKLAKAGDTQMLKKAYAANSGRINIS